MRSSNSMIAIKLQFHHSVDHQIIRLTLCGINYLRVRVLHNFWALFANFENLEVGSGIVYFDEEVANKLPTTTALRQNVGPEYVGAVEVVHQLHCLVRLTIVYCCESILIKLLRTVFVSSFIITLGMMKMKTHSSSDFTLVSFSRLRHRLWNCLLNAK